jgi:cytochrome P450
MVYFFTAPLQELFEGKKSFDKYKIGVMTGSDPMAKVRKFLD